MDLIFHLTVLDLCDNCISSIAEITIHTSLRSLNIANNNVIDLGPIASLKQLVELNVTNNLVVNFVSIISNPFFDPKWISPQKILPEKVHFQILMNPGDSVEDA